MTAVSTYSAIHRTVPRVTSIFRAAGEPAQQRVLVVDDEESVRDALARFLRSRGFEAVTADSGAAALARLSQESFDIMLCDVRMPEMTGLEVVPRALQLNADIAVLMLTAVNDATTATEALSQGAMDYLVKPIELAELEHAIERASHRRHLEIQRRNVERFIREEVAVRTVELEQEKATLNELTVGIAQTLINAMEAKDVYLAGQIGRAHV